MSTIRAAVILVVITLCVGGGAARATDPVDVRAMQAIAKSTHADKSLRWGVKSGDPCDGTWPGVHCDKDLGRVTAIDASNGGLAGTISGTDLSDLTYLSSLDLSRNRLDTATGFSEQPRPLRHLTYLNLSSNAFRDMPDYFLFSFPALETFAMDDNKDISYSGYFLADLVRCPALRTFSANKVTLTGELSDFLGNGNGTIFPALERVSLAGNSLLDDIHHDWGKDSKIKFLDISNQSINGVKNLGGRLDFVAGMTDLVEIHVRDNNFDGPLPDVSGLANLKVFDAANNNLCGRLNFPSGVAVNVDGNPGVGKDCP
ncbi:hypothetical protein EJB05_05078, partial [Eragrostis curvula]